MAFIYGILGFICCLVVFGTGFVLGYRIKTPAPMTRALPEQPDETELRRKMKEREEMEAEQRAFKALTGYSADIAYGLVELPTEKDS